MPPSVCVCPFCECMCICILKHYYRPVHSHKQKETKGLPHIRHCLTGSLVTCSFCNWMRKRSPSKCCKLPVSIALCLGGGGGGEGGNRQKRAVTSRWRALLSNCPLDIAHPSIPPSSGSFERDAFLPRVGLVCLRMSFLASPLFLCPEIALFGQKGKFQDDTRWSQRVKTQRATTSQNFAEENMFAEDISEDSLKIEDITFTGF